MVACTDLKVTSNAGDLSSYSTSSLTPTLNDLLVVIVYASGTVAAGTVTDSLGGTYTKIASFTKNAGADSGYIFVANQLAPASAMTITFDCTGDAATGCFINVFGVSGMTKTGSNAVRQSGVQSNQAGGGTPTVTLNVGAALTENPVLGFVANGVNPAALTQPTSFTEARDSGHSSPNAGVETVFRNSGHTSSSVTWGGTSGTAFGALAIELDTSAAATTPVAGTDSSSGSEISGLSALPVPTDSSSGSEASVIAANEVSSETGSSAEASLIAVVVTGSEVDVVTEASTISALQAVQDTAAGFDSGSIASAFLVTAADVGQGAELLAQLALMAATDAAIGAEDVANRITVGVSDLSAAFENALKTVILEVSEQYSVSDLAAMVAAIQGDEVSTSSEIAALIKGIILERIRTGRTDFGSIGVITRSPVARIERGEAGVLVK